MSRRGYRMFVKKHLIPLRTSRPPPRSVVQPSPIYTGVMDRPGDNRAKKGTICWVMHFDAVCGSESPGGAWSWFMGVFGGQSCGKRESADYVPYCFPIACQAQIRRRVVRVQARGKPLHHQLGVIPTCPCFPTSVCVCTVGGVLLLSRTPTGGV